MNIPPRLMVCIAAGFCLPALAQISPAGSATGNSAVSYVYVARTVGGGADNEIQAYAAAPNGKLSVIAGSPFQENVTNMAVNGKYLFATNKAGNEIESYRIGDGGALRYATSTMIAGSDNPTTIGALFLDHTGNTLYGIEFNSNGYGNNAYKSLSVQKPVGALEAVGVSSANSWLSNPASFVGSNVYAYSASCLQNMYWGIFGFKRNSNSGLLTEVGINAAPPTPPDGYFYCPSQAASDSANHVAIAMQPVNQQSFEGDRSLQLASYLVDEQGNLSTSSTRDNMPQAAVATVKQLGISPSGKLLAVSGTGGLQIFHFNAGNPITHYSALLTTDEIDQFSWDNQNHLFAISGPAGKLYVFTVTPASVEQAPGSPYSIEGPQGITVQPE